MCDVGHGESRLFVDRCKDVEGDSAEQQDKSREAEDVFVEFVDPGEGHVEDLGDQEGQAGGEALDAGDGAGALGDDEVGGGEFDGGVFRNAGRGRGE